MSRDEQPRPERRIEGLRPRSVSTESVGPSDPGAPQQERTIEALNPRTVQTESVGVDSTLVIDEEAQAERPRTLSELEGEVHSLRSRNGLLRTERTAIAGRKYALEMVLEALKEKLGQVAELCAALDAPGELGQALIQLKEMVGDARRIAEGKNLLEAELESERADKLRAVQALETKVSELSEQSIGLKAERDSLRDRSGKLERERLELLARIAELEQDRTSVQQSLEARQGEESELARRAGELEQAVVEAAETAQQLLRRAELAEKDLAEAGREAEAAREEAEAHRLNLAQLEERLEAATAMADEAVRGRDAAEEQITALQAQKGNSAELEAKLEKKDALVAELKGALSEIKPVLDELDKENRRLGRLLGEARERGRVNVEELIAREQLLRKLERLTRATAD